MNKWLWLCFIPCFLYGTEIICEDVSLADQELHIQVIDVEDELTLVASTIDEKGSYFESKATFFPKEKVIDLRQAHPISGSYEGIDSMGLFWSMEGEGSPSIHDDFFDVDLKAFVAGKLVAEKRIRRVFLSEDVETIEVREDGLVGVLYLPKGSQNVPVVITLTGSNGGISKKRAALLASHGIAAFSLGYFRAEGLPNGLEEIPIEYFEKGFKWVEKHPKLNGEISLYGVSRGGELALLLGSLFPDRFEKIVAAVPSSVVYCSLVDHQKCAWTYRGEPVLPNAPTPKIPLNPSGGKSPDDLLSTTAFLLQGKKQKEEWAAARIPVEKINADVYIFGGGDDQVWPSDLFVQEIAERMDSSRLTWEIFPDAGHGITIPFLSSSTIHFRPVSSQWFTLGGSPHANELASRISWKKVVEHLRSNTACNPD